MPRKMPHLQPRSLLLAAMVGALLLPPWAHAAPPTASSQPPASQQPAPGKIEANPAALPESPPLTPAQRLQSEIFVLRNQAEDFIQQAEADDELSAQILALLSETKTAVAAASGVQDLFDVAQLTKLRDPLLDAPLRLYEAMAAKPRAEPPTARPASHPVATQHGSRPTTGSAPPPAGQRVPPALRSGAQAFFGGDYRQAVDVLSGATFATPRQQALALLLRAAARYSLMLTADQPDDSQQKIVRAEIRECTRLAPLLRPDPALFSPRFVRLFAESGGAGKGPG